MVVVPRPGLPVSPDDLIAFCRERLARYGFPTLVGALPRNVAGQPLWRAPRGWAAGVTRLPEQDCAYAW